MWKRVIFGLRIWTCGQRVFFDEFGGIFFSRKNLLCTREPAQIYISRPLFGNYSACILLCKRIYILGLSKSQRMCRSVCFYPKNRLFMNRVMPNLPKTKEQLYQCMQERKCHRFRPESETHVFQWFLIRCVGLCVWQLVYASTKSTNYLLAVY